MSPPREKPAVSANAQVGLPARRAAQALVSAVLRDNLAYDAAFDDMARSGPLLGLTHRDRALARAISATVLRRKGQLDAIIATFLDKPLPPRSGPAQDILLCGAAQLLFMDIAPHAAIDLSVRAAARDRQARHFKGLVNAVLRKIAGHGPGLAATRDAGILNTPGWLFRRWRQAYGEQTARAICDAHLRQAALDLSAPGDAEAWAARLGALVTPTGSIRLNYRGRIGDLDGYDDGAWWVQDAAAALPVRLLGDVAGKRVLDLCAAPGGKTAQLARAGARVTAVDHAAQRVETLRANMNRLGLEVEIMEARAETYMPDFTPDAILLDAPCTATGTIRRHPDIPFLRRQSDIAALCESQRKLLAHALDLAPPGKPLVYCVCSLEPEEGIGQIDAILNSPLSVERVPIRPREIGGNSEFVTAAGDLRTLPCHWDHLEPGLRGLDGFFAARLRRI